MSAAACKEVICNSNLSATLDSVANLSRREDEFSDEQLFAMADVMDRANKDLQRIAFGED